MTKWLSIIGVAVVAALSVATAASAANDPRVPALRRQVAALVQRAASDEKALAVVAATERCDTTYQDVINIDVFNTFAALLSLPPYSGTMPSDGGACAFVGRTPPRLDRVLSGRSTPFGVLGQQLTWWAR